ncbi:MAG: M28 family peptidase [Proteobacteria bacterium]|nr:M28 family peptidase [Pseudomonadota bacterium]
MKRDMLSRLQMMRFAVIIYMAGAISCGNSSAETRAAAVGSKQRAAPMGTPASIDGRRALGYIEEIIAFGPRHAGAEGAEKTRRYIVEKLKSFGLEPKRHDFTALTPHPELKSVEMANISVDIDGPAKKRVLLGGHYDGKLLEGIDFKGANDGGSSTATLLEIARSLSRTPPPCPVRIVFFDGEEALVKWTDSDSCYGSKKMAAQLMESGEVGSFSAVVIVDMIGDKRLRLLSESSSTAWVFDVLKQTAERLGHGDIFSGPRVRIEDDHVPFLHIGIPAALLIDLNYGPGWQSNAYWHTEKDTLDKLSSKSIEIIGQVVLSSLSELALKR